MPAAPETCGLLCLDLPKAEAVRHALPGPEQVERDAVGARALGDPTRLAIAIALDLGERACVCDLAWVVGRDEKLVSHHLRQLKAAGLARSERDVSGELLASGARRFGSSKPIIGHALGS